jgi:hypothetical protein
MTYNPNFPLSAIAKLYFQPCTKPEQVNEIVQALETIRNSGE